MCRLLMLFILCVASVARAETGIDAYLQGLDLLETGKFTEAEAQFQSAIDEDDENPDFRIALGVAMTLGERLPDAQKVLERAVRLSNNADEARLWLATCIAMQGDFMKGTEIYPFAIARNEYVNEIRRMSHEYGQAEFALATARRNGNNQWDMEYARQELAKRDTIRKGFPRLGKAFSQKMKAKLPPSQQRPAPGADPQHVQQQQNISDALMQRIKSNIDNHDYAAALRDIDPLIGNGAKDPQLLVYHGICTLNTGAPEIARRQFTKALYTWPTDGELYAWRAVAAARTGDQTRAQADAETAERLGTKRAEWMREEIGKAPTADGNPVEMLKAMFESAKGGAEYASLRNDAIQLIMGRNRDRLRLDERYTDQLRELKLAVEESPGDAARLAALAAFYYDNAVSPRGEAVELRAPWKPYRSVDEADIAREMSDALDVANQALAIDAGNISAMITKAAVLVQRMQFGDAEQFLKDALARAPSEPRLLKLFAQVADRAAAAKQAQASSLRTPTTWEDQFYIYTRYPSAAERAQADELERQANQLWQMAEQTLRQAVEQAQSAGDRAYFEAVLLHRNGQFAAALDAARKAVEQEPANLEYLDMVTTLLVRMDQKVEALLNQARAANLVETTAGPVLKCVWFSLPRTKFKTSREYLDQAAAYDAADPRVAAYFGAVAGADERTDIATAWYSVACALYEASARFEGVLTDSNEASPLRADVAGTMMNVNLRAARLLRAGRPKDAEYLMRANLRMQGRIDSADLFTPIPASMLPDLDADQIPVPQADHVGYMLSVTRLELGRALLAQKRYDDAIAQFQQVSSYREQVPPTVDAGSKMQYPIAAAQIWTVSALLDSGRASRASQLYRQMPRPKQGLDSETTAELQRVMQAMDQARSDQQAQEEQQYRDQQEQMLENARQQRQQQIDQINRRRQPQRNR